MNPFVLPKLITQEQYPNCLLVPMCEPNELIDAESVSCGSSTLPSHVRYIKRYDPKLTGLAGYIDPKYAMPPKLYEHRYKNDQGIDVVIRGSYNDVMSTISVLNAYPPQKHTGIMEFDLRSGDLIDGTKPIPLIGVQEKGKHLLVKIDNKVYSGAGSLIVLIDKNKPMTLDNAKIVLFRDAKTLQYMDLGGRIDNPRFSSNAKVSPSVDKDILFKTAKNEAAEESMDLFKINTETDDYLDVESQVDNVYYRIYLYVVLVDNMNQLSTMYDQNKLKVMEEYFNMYKRNQSYRETDDLKLFDLSSFINKLKTYGVENTNISNGVFYSTDGVNRNVRGRTMKVISKLDADNMFNKIIDSKKVRTATGSGPDKVMNSIEF